MYKVLLLNFPEGNLTTLGKGGKGKKKEKKRKEKKERGTEPSGGDNTEPVGGKIVAHHSIAVRYLTTTKIYNGYIRETKVYKLSS
jgi:hypothetical protein